MSIISHSVHGLVDSGKTSALCSSAHPTVETNQCDCSADLMTPSLSLWCSADDTVTAHTELVGAGAARGVGS